MNKKRRGHYYLGGEPLPSVTTILQVLNKPGLVYWASRETANIALHDPTLSVEECTAKFNEISKEAKTRGTGVHNVYKNIIQKQKIEAYPDKYKPYVQGIYKFIEDLKPHHVSDNKIVKSKYGFAGTLDTIEQINGKLWLLDLKTGKSYKEHGLQLSAYKQALFEEGINVDKMGVLLLPGDGTYQLIPYETDFKVFLSIKQVWEWWKGE